MVNHVMLGTYSYSTQIQRYINRRLQKTISKEYMPICKIEEKKTITLLTYEVPVAEEHNILVSIARGVVDFIQRVFAIEYATHIIHTQYEFKYNEKNKLIQIFNEVWKTSLIYKDMMIDNKDLDALISPIVEQLKNERTVIVEGWIRFRLSEYKLYIEDKIERIVLEYIAYNQYKDFLTLIKQFVDAQQPVMGMIHIIPIEDGEIHLYDEGYNEITKKCIEQYGEVPNDIEICMEDLILSALITIAPLKIVIHDKNRCNNTQMIVTIQMIYGDKVRICEGCEYCAKFRTVTSQ